MTYRSNMASVPLEDDEQIVVMRWAHLNAHNYPGLELLHHIPNGGKRSGREAARFRELGVKPGIPDLHLPVACGMYHSLYIEMKRRKGGRVSEAQARCMAQLEKAGNMCQVCYGADEAIEAIRQYYKERL